MFDHCHILHVLVVVYEELARNTSGFRDDSLRLHHDKIILLSNVHCHQDTLGNGCAWATMAIIKFLEICEYWATVHVGQVLDELWGARWEWLHGINNYA
jgi:hypothetical protein